MNFSQLYVTLGTGGPRFMRNDMTGRSNAARP